MSVSRRSKWNRFGWLLYFCLAAGKASAGLDLDWKNDLQIHGFLSQGYVHTSDNNFYGDSQSGSFDLREIGLNGSLRIDPHWMVSAQLLSRRAGKMYSGKMAFDYGSVDFTPVSDEHGRLGLRLGRNKNPIGLYNDTRDVPFTRPSIFLPQSIYWDRVRNSMLAMDGLQMYGDFCTDRHSFFLQLGAGLSLIDDNIEWAFLGQNWQGELEQDDLSYGGRLLYELDDGRLRLAASGIRVPLKFDPGPSDPLPPGRVNVDYWVLSFQYNAESWSVTGEYMQEPLSWDGFGPTIDENDTTLEGYYLQGTYRLDPDWELLLRYDAGFFDKSDHSGVGQSLREDLPAFHYFNKTWTLGVTWEPMEHVMLRAQYDMVDGTMFLSNRENPVAKDQVRYWDIFSLLLSLGF
jgi:hypothetical protein